MGCMFSTQPTTNDTSQNTAKILHMLLLRTAGGGGVGMEITVLISVI